MAVDITAVDEDDDVFEGMCQCCCSSECTCLSDIESSSLAVQSGLALPGPCSPIPWLACTDEVRTCTMSETNYTRGSNCNSGNWRRVPDAIAPSDFSFEVCSAACIADVYCTQQLLRTLASLSSSPSRLLCVAALPDREVYERDEAAEATRRPDEQRVVSLASSLPRPSHRELQGE